MPADAGPSAFEIVAMLVAAWSVRLFLLWSRRDYVTEINWFLDNEDYLRIASLLRQWTWSCQPDCPTHAWGLPFAIVTVASALRVSHESALVALSAGASLIAGVLTRRLYGGWVAAALVATGFTWVSLAVLGSSEPLYLCLLYGAFARARAGGWRAAAVFATLGWMVRPVGAIAVLVLVIDAVRRRRPWQALAIAAIAVGLTAIYFVPIVALAHDPLAVFRGYGSDWFSPFPVSVPLLYLVRNWGTVRELPLDAVLAAAWLAIALASLWRLWSKPQPRLPERERLFAMVYILFFLSATYEGAVMFLPRFLLPVAPIMLSTLEPWIPRSRPLLWTLSLTSGLYKAGLRTWFTPR